MYASTAKAIYRSVIAILGDVGGVREAEERLGFVVDVGSPLHDQVPVPTGLAVSPFRRGEWVEFDRYCVGCYGRA